MPPACVEPVPRYTPAYGGLVGFPLVLAHDRVVDDPGSLDTVPRVVCTIPRVDEI